LATVLATVSTSLRGRSRSLKDPPRTGLANLRQLINQRKHVSSHSKELRVGAHSSDNQAGLLIYRQRSHCLGLPLSRQRRVCLVPNGVSKREQLRLQFRVSQQAERV